MALSIVTSVVLDMTRQFIPPLHPPYLALVQLKCKLAVSRRQLPKRYDDPDRHLYCHPVAGALSPALLPVIEHQQLQLGQLLDGIAQTLPAKT